MKASVVLVKSLRSLSLGWVSSRLCEFTWYDLNLGGPCKAGLSDTFLQMGAKCGATRISLCSKLNRLDRVSRMIFNYPGLCSTVKSYD